jgi:YHS domain-containing protein
MIVKIIILIAIGYFGFRLLKSWIVKHITISRTGSDQPLGEIDDVMIQDPLCKVYFPKRSGVHLHKDGKDLYFCSAECRQRYISNS